jgi:glyoxylase-like metal-dependent hydrolase (beta-lactamase superfamily II)
MEKFGRIAFIPGSREGRYPYCNSLFIDDGIKAIIDPGSDKKELLEISRPGPGMVINSHYHEDHRTYLDFFPDADLLVHGAEAPCYISINSFLDYYGLLGRRHEQAWRDLAVNRFNYRERPPDREITDGDLIDFGDTSLKVIHTPGHSPGHCCFHFPRERVLFMADYDMTSFGPWYGDRVSDIDQTIESVQRILETDADIYISSHASVMRGDISGLAKAYIGVIDAREHKLLEYLAEPRTLDEITGRWICYGRCREPDYFYEFCERALIRKHLERLEKNGGATCIEDGRYIRN